MQKIVKGVHNAFFRQLLFLAVLVTLGIVIFWELNFFVGAFLGAITMYVVLRNMMFRLVEKKKWNRWLAATVLVLQMAVVLTAIGYFVFRVIASEIPGVNPSAIVAGLKRVPNHINEFLGFQIITGQVMDQLTKFAGTLLTSFVNTTYSFAANVFMMLVILYFMLGNARAMERRIYEYIPFRGRSLLMIRTEVRSMIFSNAIGIPLIMIGQGLTSALIFWLVGIENAFFWGFLTAICGLIPMIGTVIVTLPMGIYLIVGGDVASGVILIACGLLIVANVDNLFRIVMMKQMADTHPLVVIFGVILGIPLFGFWGIIFGPLMISSFFLLIRIYYWEYKLMNVESAPPKPLEEKKQ